MRCPPLQWRSTHRLIEFRDAAEFRKLVVYFLDFCHVLLLLWNPRLIHSTQFLLDGAEIVAIYNCLGNTDETKQKLNK